MKAPLLRAVVKRQRLLLPVDVRSRKGLGGILRVAAEWPARAHGSKAMASISILVPTMFVACIVERAGRLPGKNSP